MVLLMVTFILAFIILGDRLPTRPSASPASSIYWAAGFSVIWTVVRACTTTLITGT